MRRLNRVLVTTTAIIALVGLPVVALAGIGSTAHDLSGGVGGGQICVVCHAPHNPTNLSAGPLWNHDSTAVTSYGVYSSDTLDATVDGTPGPQSLLCLSCHDGTVSIDAFGGGGGGATMATDAGGYVGTDLSDDHPVGFTYTQDGGLVDPGSLTDVVLFGTGDDQLECASCHDAHDNANTKFLRVALTDSAICTACHTK